MGRKIVNIFENFGRNRKISFEELFHKYKNYMFSIALRYLNNKEDAEDAVQEACLRLSKNMHKLEDLESDRTRGFISIITRNVCSDILNKNKDESNIDKVFDLSVDDEFTNEIENIDTLDRMVSTLNDRYKNVLILSYIHDLTDTEIASSLNLTEVNVRKIRSRALKALRINFKEEEYG